MQLLLSDKVKQYYDQGKAYLQNGQMEKAIENLQKVIQLQPDLANVYIHLGAAYYALGQYEQAIDHIQKHIQLQPKSAMAYIALGNVYNSMKQHKKAIECYAKAAELQPDNATPYYCMGIIHFQLGDYKKAIDNFKVAIDLQPFTSFEGKPERKAGAKLPYASLANIYINMGAAYIKLRQYKQAILSCLKAIELEPKSVETYNNLGVAYASLGQYDSAIEHLKQASKLQPSNVSTHFNMGVIFSRLDKYNEAVSHFSRIISNNPPTPFIKGDCDADDDIQSSPLEVVYAQLKQSGDFIMTSQQVVEIQPDEEAKVFDTLIASSLATAKGLRHNILADAYSGEGQYEAAISCYKKVIELQPDNAMAYYNLGKLYFKHQEELQGIECFSKVIELQPDSKISKKALDAILLFNDVRVVKPLIFALNSKDKYSRLCAVSQLGKLGDSSAVKPLIELLDDNDEDICQYAAKTLIKLKEKAVAPLINAMEFHESEDVRQHAAYILEQIGADDALKALEEIEKQDAEDAKRNKRMAKKTTRKEYSRKTTLWSIFSGR